MPEIIIKKDDIKAGALGDGRMKINLAVPTLLEPLKQTDDELLRVEFELGSGESFALGSERGARLAFENSTKVRLFPIWMESSQQRKDVLKEFGLDEYFNVHQDRVLLVFRAGSEVEGGGGVKIRHASLSANATLRAGAEAHYSMIRSAEVTTPAGAQVRDFFAAMSMPADVAQPLTGDQVIIFEYGGYLNFKTGLTVGYELVGSPSSTIGELQLSQKYGFSLLAKLNLSAKLVGQFKVIVRPGADPGWVRVTVNKSRSKSSSIAAVVDAFGRLETEGWPSNANELLGSILGLKAKNWINLFDQIATLADFKTLEDYLDNLAVDFIERYTGKAFDTLREKTQFDEFLARVHNIAKSYQQLDNHAITLFDRYFDPIKKEVDERLTAALKKIEDATSWDSLKVQVNLSVGDILWDVIQQLTDGDPFGWLGGETGSNDSGNDSLDQIRKRAIKALALIQSSAHEEIRQLIALAKSEFPLDHFIEELDDVTNLGGLEAKANAKLTGFVERVIGRAIDTLSRNEARAAIKAFHNALRSISKFRDTVYIKVTQAINQSLEFHLQAAYSRAEEDKALFDFELDLGTDEGRKLMNEAGQGDFAGVLGSFNAKFVKLRKGTILHRVTRESRVSMNIVGWHRRWHYLGMDRLIIQAEQRIQADAAGQLTAITEFDLEKERERKRNGERVYTHLLLRFLGVSRGKLESDDANRMFLVDAISRMSAEYNLVLADPRTKPEELMKYLGFAREFGLSDSAQEAFEKFEPILPTDADGNFGEVSLSYNVHFTEKGMHALLNPTLIEAGKFKPAVEEMLRNAMRLIVLANYSAQANLTNIAWAYWTPGVYRKRQQEGAAFIPPSPRELSPIYLSPVGHLKAPAKVLLTPQQFQVLDTLYKVEDSLIQGMAQLSRILSQNGKMQPKEFENALGDFGNALTDFDRFDKGDNTVFAVFDRLIQLAGGEGRYSSLMLAAKLNGQEFRGSLIA